VSEGGSPSAEDVQSHLDENFQGESISLTDENIATVTDTAKVSKYYKLNGLNWLDGIKDSAAKQKETEMLILGGMALRGV
jgi:EKC/KEOPS complex subunit CGI121/TPRKB